MHDRSRRTLACLILLAFATSAGGCCRRACPCPAPALRPSEPTWSIHPIVEWAPEGTTGVARSGAPVVRGLPAGQYVRAVGFGATGDLWVGTDEDIVRITGPASDQGIATLRMPTDEWEHHLTLQTLAPRGPGGRVAVGTGDGYVVVSTRDEPLRLRLFPMREDPIEAGIMPLVGWTGSGAVLASVHLTCDLVALDPDTGRDVWRRTETVARYSALSPNGRFLLLPWALPEAAAEVLDAATGATRAQLAHAEGSSYGAIDDSGRWVVMGRYDEELTIWDTTSKATSIVSMQGDGEHLQPIGLAFLPGSTRCVVASSSSVGLLDVPNRRWLASWSLPGEERFDVFMPQSDLAVSADGTRVALRLESGGGVLVLRVQRTP